LGEEAIAMAEAIIAVLPDPADWNVVRLGLGRDGIDIHVVASAREAVKLMETESISVVLYDADNGQPWRDALPQFLTTRPGSRVILLAKSANRQTWFDLFDTGGFDMLLRPFRPVELRGIVRLALSPPKFFCAAA